MIFIVILLHIYYILCKFLPYTPIKGSPISKALTCMKIYLYKKMTILSWRLILLAILFYEQFIHLTQINSHPNIQFLSSQQHAYQSFFGYFLV